MPVGQQLLEQLVDIEVINILLCEKLDVPLFEFLTKIVNSRTVENIQRSATAHSFTIEANLRQYCGEITSAFAIGDLFYEALDLLAEVHATIIPLQHVMSTYATWILVPNAPLLSECL